MLLDNVQFRKNEFQNRNRFCIPTGTHWLTVPVTFNFGDTIRGVRVAQEPWAPKLWRTIEHTYAKAPYFAAYAQGLKAILDRQWTSLADINEATVRWLLDCFEIRTPLVVASQMPAFTDERTERLVDICRHLKADVYLSGSCAKCYLELEKFESVGIKVEFQLFEHPVYRQVNSPDSFQSHMSAIDGLFNCGGGIEGQKLLNLTPAMGNAH